MAADDVRVNYHLGPGGWTKGETGYFSEPSETADTRPSDTVVTIQERELDSGWGMPSITIKEVWREEGANDGAINALLRKYRVPSGQEGPWLETWKKFIAAAR